MMMNVLMFMFIFFREWKVICLLCMMKGRILLLAAGVLRSKKGILKGIILCRLMSHSGVAAKNSDINTSKLKVKTSCSNNANVSGKCPLRAKMQSNSCRYICMMFFAFTTK
ncbi:hypothetical protein Mapa_008126 [Marchantia paleacea]|nr:hypothetical protein Mapa_008126 [Marchantia paleacea]